MTIYRFFEILPGALAWLTFALIVLLAWLLPAPVSIFIILFDIYWLLKTIYLSFHLRASFRVMRENLKINWVRRLEELSDSTLSHPRDVYHLVILPMSREPYAVVKEGMASIAAANYPKDKMFMVLAVEAWAGDDARRTAERLAQEFGNTFSQFLVTVHPEGLPGEIRGKGSNETWAARKAKEAIVDPRSIPYENVLVSVFDVDTQVPSEYFGRLTYVFKTAKNRLRAIYQPIPFFTNNIYDAPALGRVVSFSATFWQMMQQSRPERLTSFSSQSLPFPVLLDVGFWHRDIVSEDSRIFWQAYVRYHGDFRCEPLHFPVYMDANVAPTLWQTLKNTYRQQRRWAWGVENVAYTLTGFARDKAISARKKWYWRFNMVEGYHSWATNALMIFALGWLPVVIGGKEFNYTLLSYSLPQITRFIMTCSMVGIATSALLSLILLPPRPAWFRPYHSFLYILQWALMPLTLIIFGCIPAVEAQTRLLLGGRFRLGFWVTPKGRYPK